MNDERLVKVSKYLSRHLRHQPERLRLRLAPGGWVLVDDLLAACVRQGFAITRQELDEVVERNNKQRFSFDDTGTMIRANQGHSVAVDLQLVAVDPPDILYHGTSEGAVEAIMRDGLLKMGRHHVHLSTDTATAHAVGTRHGRPVVFAVDARTMQQEGHLFYRSANGVWLVEQVLPQYLRRTYPPLHFVARGNRGERRRFPQVWRRGNRDRRGAPSLFTAVARNREWGGVADYRWYAIGCFAIN